LLREKQNCIVREEEAKVQKNFWSKMVESLADLEEEIAELEVNIEVSLAVI
jgi:hypothetical protein